MTARPHSLRRRLLGWLLVSTAVLGVAALIDTGSEAVTSANRLSDRVLAGSALVIAERASVDADGGLVIEIPYGALEMLSSPAEDRVFYRVDGPGGLVTGYGDLALAPAVEGQEAAFADAMFRDTPVRVASLSRRASTGVDAVPFTVTVAETTIARQELTRAMLLRSALRLLGMILGAAAIVWVSVTLSLRPLYRLGEAIALRSPGDLGPIDEAAPSEVQGLVDTVNSFMRRLKTALDAMRNFTGNAGHQLRTPLAVARTQIALAERAGSLEEAQAALRKGDAALARADRIIAQLLLLARVDAAGGSHPPLHPVDIAALAREVTAEHVPGAVEAGIDLGFEGGAEVMAAADPLLLTELLGNLILNALAYAGRGAVVTVRASVGASGGDGAVLEVEDDGPGIPAARRKRIRDRFARGEGERAEGLGLGLPIVEEIATLFGGRVELTEGAGGRGLRVRLILPGAAVSPA